MMIVSFAHGEASFVFVEPYFISEGETVGWTAGARVGDTKLEPKVPGSFLAFLFSSDLPSFVTVFTVSHLPVFL